jgi:cytoskeletal protein RodZ
MSIGTQLRQAREAQSLSLDQAAQATHIRLHYLEALEADQFEHLPSTAQLRGFLRAYSDYLRLDSTELIRLLDKDAVAGPVAPAPSMPTDEVSVSSASSEAIFNELGNTLKSQRELMGLSLGDVERHTHIRMHYIDALERGDLAHLPSPVQGRGMLSNYASFLGLNTESVLLRFADGLQADLYDRQAARKSSPASAPQEENGRIPARPSQLKRLFSMDLFVGGFIIVFLLGFTLWGALRIAKLNSAKESSPTAPSISAILLSSPEAGLTGTPTLNPSAAASVIPTEIIDSVTITTTLPSEQTATPVIIVSTPGLENAPVQVNIVANQRAWMRVIVDGETVFVGRVTPGSAYTFAGNDRIELLTGDASSLRVYFNQQDLGPLGSFGQVVERIFTISGVETATPSHPSTSTLAPTGTVTPTPTVTPKGLIATPSPTPRP